MPRAGLSRGAVVAAAAQLADEVGWSQLTLAALAARLGVRLPSLYKHIDSLDGLRRDVAVLALGELGAALARSTVGRARGEALHALAAAYRRYALDRPGCYAATVRAPAPGDVEHAAAADSVLHVVQAVLAGYHLAGPDAVDATRALRAAMHGFVSLEAEGGFALPADVEHSYARLVDGLDATLTGWAQDGTATRR